jgi:hypothetical protein
MKSKILPIFLFFCLALFLTRTTLAYAGASLSLTPATKSLLVGDSFEVVIVLDTGGAKTDGADIIINFDEMKLSASSASLGNLYDNKINEDVSHPGKIVLQAVSDVGSSFSGTGTLATINFKSIAGGLGSVAFEMKPDSSLDCNVNYRGTDLLASVSNGAYTSLPEGIGAGVATPSGTATPTLTGTLTPTPTLPATGWGGPTILGLGFGGLLLFVALSMLVFL